MPNRICSYFAQQTLKPKMAPCDRKGDKQKDVERFICYHMSVDE